MILISDGKVSDKLIAFVREVKSIYAFAALLLVPLTVTLDEIVSLIFMLITS